MILTIIVFILVIGLLIFAHEFGHFLAAKKAGVKVLEFAFGFPPTLYKKKIGETTYAINLIPLGGYVKLHGEGGEHPKDPRSFSAQSVKSRFLIVVLGVVANFILAWILFTIGFATSLPVTTVQSDEIRQARVENQVIVAETVKGSPAEMAGLSLGDIIIGADSQTFNQANELTDFTRSHLNQTVILKVKRYGKLVEIPVKLSGDSKAPLGVGLVEGEKVRSSLAEAPYLAAKEVGNLIILVLEAVGRIFKTLVVSGQVEEGVAGPVGILFLFKTAAKLGFSYIIQLTALISVNLGIINFLPFPALDGGKFVFLSLEAIRRKKVTPQVENLIHAVGFAILIILIILITFRDVTRILM